MDPTKTLVSIAARSGTVGWSQQCILRSGPPLGYARSGNQIFTKVIQGVCMSGSTLDQAIGGALTVLAFWIAFLVLRFVWRMLVGASRRLPEGVEGTARLAGKVAAKAEKSASKAIRAFNEGRKGP